MTSLVVALAFLCASPSTPPTPSGPSLRLTLEHRLRAEGLHHDFRAPQAADVGGLCVRSLAAMDAEAGPFVGTLEFIDARALLHGAPPSTAAFAHHDVDSQLWPPLVPEVGVAVFMPGPFVAGVDGVPRPPAFFAWMQLVGRLST